MKASLLFVALAAASAARAEVELRADVFASAFCNGGWFVNTRSRFSAAFGLTSLAAYPVLYFDRLDTDVRDTMYGAGARLGQSVVISLDAGRLVRSFRSDSGVISGTGYYAALGAEVPVGRYLGLFLPAVAKKTVEGDLSERLTVDVLPNLTFRLPL